MEDHSSSQDNSRFYCEHCGEKISKTLYYLHKKLYYSVDTNMWQKITNSADDQQCNDAECDEFTFSDSESTTHDHGMLLSMSLYMCIVWHSYRA